MSASMFSPVFVIGHIRIGTVEGASCVNLGNNYPIGFKSQKKHNQGFGNLSGDSHQVSGARAVLHDADRDEWLEREPDDQVPDWVKELVAESMSANQG